MAESIVTLFGADRPGALAQLSRTIADNDGNIGVCRSVVMHGYHGIMLEVTAPLSAAELEERLKPLVRYQSFLNVVPITTTARAHARQYVVSVLGEDSKGLMARVSELLAENGFNITGADAGRVGQHTYVMRFQADLADGAAQADVESLLRNDLKGVHADISNIEPASAGLVGAVAKISDVRLKTSLFHLDGKVEEGEESLYHTGYFADIRGKADDRLTVEVGFRLMLREPQVEDGPAAQPLNASATFELDYRLPMLKGIQDDELQAFADTSGVFSALPYWRQLVQSMLPSMGVHKLIIPAFPLPLVDITGTSSP